MKKIICFFAMFLYIIGTIGGIGYCLYNHAYVIAVAVLVLAVLAMPAVYKIFNYLINQD